mgnify:CR=1 FL=1
MDQGRGEPGARTDFGFTGVGAAARDARERGSLEVPAHLRNAPTGLLRKLGAGRDYRYAHDESGGVALGENYFPDDMDPVTYYHPVPRGLEIRIKEKLDEIARLARDREQRKD